jgi:hypothetical protein
VDASLTKSRRPAQLDSYSGVETLQPTKQVKLGEMACSMLASREGHAEILRAEARKIAGSTVAAALGFCLIAANAGNRQVALASTFCCQTMADGGYAGSRGLYVAQKQLPPHAKVGLQSLKLHRIIVATVRDRGPYIFADAGAMRVQQSTHFRDSTDSLMSLWRPSDDDLQPLSDEQSAAKAGAKGYGCNCKIGEAFS